MLLLWGLAGAFVYATNALIFHLWNEGQTKEGRIKAAFEYVSALVTGAIFAQGFTGAVMTILAGGININGHQFELNVDRVAVALTIGWSSNYLWPRLLRKIGKRVDALALDEEKK